ncbi:DUF4177 domain-containing protein [Paludisphaera sp.]|uniref:DUF4177 domain-containing protein n=1 Tax=Paludisphaera sp. TaxID=2017432 RepID=UPI00301C540B
MLHISCPSCGERGKIPANLVGARIKCKKCNNAFQVTDPARAPVAVAAQAATATFEGIAVEGLDPASWSLAPDSSHVVPTMPAPDATHAADSALEPAPPSGPTREYKLLTSRDKFFEGKFELGRLEEAINHYARQGWAAKSMCLPHIKNFQGAMQEEIVVLLER